jgi:hypothetical protein
VSGNTFPFSPYFKPSIGSFLIPSIQRNLLVYGCLVEALLTFTASSNPLFADYTLHNMNVFSIVDNFSYQDGTKTSYLQKATADYFVIGWHADSNDDPMTTYPHPKDPKIPTPVHSTRLKDCRMQILNSSTEAGVASAWLDTSDSSRILSHASMYGVNYDRSKEPDTIGAVAAGQKMQERQPISVGVSPMDALLTYCRAHSTTDSDPQYKEMEQDLLRIDTLLNTADDDDIDGLQAAADESYSQAFQKYDGGSKWNFKTQQAPGKPPVVPTHSQQEEMKLLNAVQAAFDNAGRETQTVCWQLFASWWNYVSGFWQDGQVATTAKLKKLNDRFDELSIGTPNGRIATLSVVIKALRDKLEDPSKGTSDRFFQRKDPTIMFGHVSRGWDADFTDTLNVRLLDQVVKPSLMTASPGWENFSTIFETLSARLPPAIQGGALGLLKEFYTLRPSNNDALLAKPPALPQVLPWYYNAKARTAKLGRDCWNNTQPWRPLFIEWEATYYHIPFQSWKFKEYDRRWNWGARTVHFGVDDSVDISTLGITDTRRISGRNILVPQVSTMLTTTLEQIFTTTNAADLADPKGYNLPPAEQKKLLDIIKQVEIVSAPLTGLTSHLLTLNEGSHITPFVTLPNQGPVFIQTAADAFKPAIDPKDTTISAEKLIKKMDAETSLTPYGDSVAAESDQSPMKPVTHGQLMFTKLNIIDKFGQAVAIIDTNPHRKNTPVATTNPCISDSLFPGTINGIKPSDASARANVVNKQLNNDSCPFISLPPAINQPARINAQFVQRDLTSGLWRRCSDWENPIWGWLVINYADNGLQIFLADGTFYREVRLGGRVGTTAGFKWLPFDPPAARGTQIVNSTILQLDHLIDLLATPNDNSYLRGFFDMINQSLDDNQSHAPKSYATFSSAIVGKPLALVNAGWSLELAGPENTNWSTSNKKLPERTLLDPKKQPPHVAMDAEDGSGGQLPINSPAGYTFPVKLGDAERSFDGLVGYFPVTGAGIGAGGPTSKVPPPVPAKGAHGMLHSDLDLRTLYTFFTETLPPASSRGIDPRIPLSVPPPPGKPTAPIVPVTPLQLTPYYIRSDPVASIPSSVLTGDTTAAAQPPALAQHDKKLTVFGLIVDPFLPVHAYTAILPNQPLQLPTWAVETALQKMTAFWRAGPLMVTTDPLGVPDSVPPQKIGIPLAAPAASASGQGATYNWLQPNWVPDDSVATVSGSGTTSTPMVTRYKSFDVAPFAASGGDASGMQLEPGPYTAVEGYVQILKSLAG